jgi:hypothetical protein
MIFEIIISLILYSIYIQFSPSMGNIWIRQNHNNENILCLNNLLILIFKPLTEWYFWSINFLSINYWIYLIIILIIFNTYKFYS